jgi:nucleotide-binding universal stress UspA family protein
MYRKIVVGYDDSSEAKDALALGQQLAAASGGELVVSAVSVVHATLRANVDPVEVEDEHDLMAHAGAAAQAAGATSRDVESTSVPRGLHELAEEIGADLVVVGSSRHSAAGQVFLGNVGVSLLHGTPCAVAVAPKGYADAAGVPLSNVVVGYDGSPEAQVALDAASELARATGARIRLVAAAEPPPMVFGRAGSGGWAAVKDEVEAALRKRLEDAAASIEGDVHAELVGEAPADALADAAREPGSIVFLGSRGYGPVRSVLLGSVSRALARMAPAPIVVHPRGAETGPETAAHAQAGTNA